MDWLRGRRAFSSDSGDGDDISQRSGDMCSYSTVHEWRCYTDENGQSKCETVTKKYRNCPGQPTEETTTTKIEENSESRTEMQLQAHPEISDMMRQMEQLHNGMFENFFDGFFRGRQHFPDPGHGEENNGRHPYEQPHFGFERKSPKQNEEPPRPGRSPSSTDGMRERFPADDDDFRDFKRNSRPC